MAYVRANDASGSGWRDTSEERMGMTRGVRACQHARGGDRVRPCAAVCARWKEWGGWDVAGGKAIE